MAKKYFDVYMTHQKPPVSWKKRQMKYTVSLFLRPVVRENTANQEH